MCVSVCAAICPVIYNLKRKINFVQQLSSLFCLVFESSNIHRLTWKTGNFLNVLP